MTSFDLIIIGLGPAGYTASVYASRYKINHALIGEVAGGLAGEAHKVGNYPSEDNIGGLELMDKMRAHVDALGAPVIESRVLELSKSDSGFLVKTADQELSAKTVLLAIGTHHRQLGLEEEKRLLGKGVSYCATCDAAFYRNRVTAVLGSGNSALTAALRLAEIASKVYLINRSSELKGEAIWQEQVRNNPKIELIVNNTIKALKGENKLEAIVFENHYSDSDELAVDGLFIEIGTTPDDSLFTALDVRTTDKGYIITDASQMTSLPGLFAAGDITTASNGFRQIITACAEGAVAIDSISNYLRRV